MVRHGIPITAVIVATVTGSSVIFAMCVTGQKFNDVWTVKSMAVAGYTAAAVTMGILCVEQAIVESGWKPLPIIGYFLMGITIGPPGALIGTIMK